MLAGGALLWKITASMMKNKRVVVLIAAAALLVAGVAAFQLALRQLRAVIEQALGPQSSVAAVELGWTGVELRELRVRAAGKQWPAEDELRAARVKVVPDLRSLLGGAWRVHSVTVDDAYVSVLRTRDGRPHVLPALIERQSADDAAPAAAASAAPSAATELIIGAVIVNNARVEFFDASVRQPAHRMSLQALQVELKQLALPSLDRPVSIALHGIFKGVQRDGEIAIDGQLTPATRDAKLTGRLSGVDLLALQPYLMRVNEGGVRRGILDLKFQAGVQKNQLHAPGTVTISGLELASGGGMFSTFAGVPRQAVLAAMSRDGRIELQFTLEGRLDDPKFSLNELFAKRMAVGLAETLGVSVRGVVEGVGGVIKGLFGR